VLCRLLTPFHAWGRLRTHILLSLNALAILMRLFSPRFRLLAILAYLTIRPLPALGSRSVALPLLIELASLMLEVALQLPFTYLSIAILSHPLD